MFHIIKESILDFKRNKVRTFLTTLGIIIGITAVVLLQAVGVGLKNFIKQQFDSLGTNLLIVMPGQILQGGSFRSSPGGGTLGGAEFDIQDVQNLKKIRSASQVAPVFMKTLSASFGEKTETADLFATTGDLFPLRNLEAEYGSVFTSREVEKKSRSIVIGNALAIALFTTPEKAVGKTITLDDQRFRVMGVLKKIGGGGLGGPNFDSFAYVPYTAAYTFNPDKTFITVYIKARSEDTLKQTRREAETQLERRYDAEDFSVIEQTEILNAVNSIFSALNSVLVVIGAISLIVGGIGIMNIMYVSVVERTKEIGIRRALGATKQDILKQFLVESVMLSLLGGVGGLVISGIFVLIMRNFFPAEITLFSVLLATGVSALIGITFGVFPARKAANLSPIEAMRFE